MAALSGGFGLAGGYLTVSQQRRSAVEQRRDQVLALRRNAYHGFLNVGSELGTLLASGRALDTAELYEWVQRLTSSYNLLSLAGTGAVLDRAKAFMEILRSVEQARAEKGPDPLAVKLRRAYRAREHDIDTVRHGLVEAMQRDVTDEGGPGPHTGRRGERQE